MEKARKRHEVILRKEREIDDFIKSERLRDKTCLHRNYSYKGYLICAECGLTKRDFDTFAFNEGDESRVHMTTKKSSDEIMSRMCDKARGIFRKIINDLSFEHDISLDDLLKVFRTYVLTDDDRGNRNFRISARPEGLCAALLWRELLIRKVPMTMLESGFTMTGDIDMGNNKILKLADPITSKSAVNKEYVDNNFLGKHGGLLLGNIAMSGQSITDLNPTPQNNNDAVTKGYVDNQIRLSGGLSLSGITMQGDIDMNGHEISGLVDPINDDMAASKGFVESNFLDLAGGTMIGNVDMGGYEITNMLRTPTTDLSAVTKKWVTDQFPTKQEILSGFTLSGPLNLSGNEIYGLPDVPTTDNSATSKKYVDGKFVSGGGLSSSRFTMSGDINMGGYEVIGVTSVPSFNNSLVNKKYVDDEVQAVRGGITQAQGDARYVRKVN